MTTATAEPRLRDALSEAARSAEALAAAQARATEAQAKAAAAQERATAQQEAARRRHAQGVVGAFEADRQRRRAAVAEARQTFEAAVLEGGPVIPAFLDWCRALGGQYATDHEHHAAQVALGSLKVQAPVAPAPNLSDEVDMVLRRAALELADEALAALRSRRLAVLAGEEG